tara:strand:+ start:9333 stop:9632 length:300 start_codon:yes stop_codon:yes gene_type:complete
MARPKKHNIDTKQLQNLARLGCTNTEIADFFGCSENTIRRYGEYLTKGRAECKMRLRQMQWKSAESGNVTMQIFLGKQVLGQSDTPDNSGMIEPLPFID